MIKVRNTSPPTSFLSRRLVSDVQNVCTYLSKITERQIPLSDLRRDGKLIEAKRRNLSIIRSPHMLRPGIHTSMCDASENFAIVCNRRLKYKAAEANADDSRLSFISASGVSFNSPESGITRNRSITSTSFELGRRGGSRFTVISWTGLVVQRSRGLNPDEEPATFKYAHRRPRRAGWRNRRNF